MKISYKNWEWNDVGEIALNPEVFASGFRKDIIARVIRWQQAKSRSGNRDTKTLSEVSGTTRKPWAQKETGRARQGSLRAPQFRGGGVVFGPHPRDFSHKLNKKVRKLGLISSLSFRVKEGSFTVLDSLDIPFEKTKAFASWLSDREIKSVLFVSATAENDILFKCIRNVPYCDVLPVCGLNVLDIVKHKHIICDLEGVKAIEERLTR